MLTKLKINKYQDWPQVSNQVWYQVRDHVWFGIKNQIDEVCISVVGRAMESIFDQYSCFSQTPSWG